MDSLQIPGDADQIPFLVNRFDPSERKLSKSKHRFDDPKNRFWRTLALGINRATRGRLQPVFHLLHFRGILAGWIRTCQEFLEFQRVTFSLHCNGGGHVLRDTTLDVGLTEVSMVGQEFLGPSQGLRQGLERLQGRFQFLFVIGPFDSHGCSQSGGFRCPRLPGHYRPAQILPPRPA